MAAARRRHRVLTGFAATGWIFVVVLGALAEAYTADSKPALVGAIVVGLCALWAAVIVGSVVTGILERRRLVDDAVSHAAETLLLAFKPVPWVRLSAVLIMVAVGPIVVQDLAAAGAGALHLGRIGQFVTDSYSYGGRGSVVAIGTWSDLSGSHKAALMDATPQPGQSIAVRVPPLGGHSVYSGAPLSWFASLILLVVLVGFAVLVRSTVRTLQAPR